MKLVLSQQKLNVIVCSHGCYRRLIFNPMPEGIARELVRQYGSHPEEVHDTFLDSVPYSIEVDDLQVLEWLDRRHTFYGLTPAMLHETVRAYYPNLLRIKGAKAFIASYKRLIFDHVDLFIYSK